VGYSCIYDFKILVVLLQVYVQHEVCLVYQLNKEIVIFELFLNYEVLVFFILFETILTDSFENYHIEDILIYLFCIIEGDFLFSLNHGLNLLFGA
jgi:hypothetical protein